MEPDSLSKVAADGVEIAYRSVGKGSPLLLLNGFAAASEDWDPSFIHRLASSNQLILLDNRGLGGSTDDGHSFGIHELADDAAHVIKALGFKRTNVLGWSMGGYIAQALALEHTDCVDKLILLSTDSGAAKADLASAAVWSKLIDTSGTPSEQAQRLLSLLFPAEVAESFYRIFGNIVAKARAQLPPDLLRRQAAAMDAWHRVGVAGKLKEIDAPVLIATGTEDIVIPSSNSLKLANAIPGAWLAQFRRSGHAFIAQYPQRVAELINTFLASEDAR
ncbi:MAG TPA: alpha/beta hydrolase [Candidatus Udaeobacter sp.]|jgi:pimeloyl-ACP methyl ester carboxylesterase|nr:alpha/beta hydrolase [Candidatus Udaeobacter sp.]